MKISESIPDHTKEQSAIITSGSPFSEVIASPGCGKTTTLVARYNWLISSGKASTEDILVLSFSNSTVDQLKYKLPDDAEVRTFHSFGSQLHARATGAESASKQFTLINSQQRFSILKEVISTYPAIQKSIKKCGINLTHDKEVNRLAHFFESIQRDGQIARQLVSDANTGFSHYQPAMKRLSKLYAAYNRLKELRGLWDYADMVAGAQKALESRTVPLAYCYLLVDEYQDMSKQQAKLLTELSRHIPNMMVFGDPNQAIYGFAGQRYYALPELINKSVKIFHLNHSFRLGQKNADLAAQVVKSSGVNAESLKIQCAGTGKRPRIFQCKTQSDQHRQVQQIITKLLEQGVELSQIALLARIKAQLRDAEQWLQSSGIPFNPIYRPTDEIHTSALIAILELLEKHKVLGNPIKHADRPVIAHQLQAILSHPIDEKKVGECVSMFASAVRGQHTFKGLYRVALQIYEKVLRAHSNLDANVRTQLGNLEPLCHDCKSVKTLRTRIKASQSRQAVITSTINQAKGREWQYVIVLNVIDGSLPFCMSFENDDKLAEERNLLYVALTRVRNELCIMEAPYQRHRPNKLYNKPSRFLSSSDVRKLAQIVPVGKSPAKPVAARVWR